MAHLHVLQFAELTSLELQNLFETGSDKLKNIIKNSKLPKHIKQLIPYFENSIPGSNYYVENKFNSYVSKINPRFSVFHLDIRSLNCHYKEVIAFLHLLSLKFDCICLSELWSTNLKSYESIFQNYIPFFAEPINSKVSGVVILLKMTTRYVK